MEREQRILAGQRVWVNDRTVKDAINLAVTAWIQGLSLAQAKDLLDQVWDVNFPGRKEEMGRRAIYER